VTDEQIRDLLKPRSHLGAILGTVITVAGAVWAGTTWLQSRADKTTVDRVNDDLIRVRIELPTMNGKIERVEQSQNRMEKALERVEAKLENPRRRRNGSE